MQPNKRAHAQSGNALFLILIGVALFAALAFTFTRGNQQGTDSITKRQAEIATSDIITYAQRVSRTVDGLLSHGKSETQISFEGMPGTYTNAACTDDSCKVFAGGANGILPVNPVESWFNQSFSSDYSYMAWYVSAQFCVPQMPDNTCSPPKGNDLVLILPGLKQSLCEMINTKLGLPVPVPTATTFGSITAAARFNGSYNPAGGAVLWDAAGLAGKSSGCVYNNSRYYFFQILSAR